MKKPFNISFWKSILKDKNAIDQFLSRGIDRQKKEIKNILLYTKKQDPDFFEEVNGKEILEKLK